MGVGSGFNVIVGVTLAVGSAVFVAAAVIVGGIVVGFSVGSGEVGVSAGGSVIRWESVGVFRALARTLIGESGLHPAITNVTGIK